MDDRMQQEHHPEGLDDEEDQHLYSDDVLEVVEADEDMPMDEDYEDEELPDLPDLPEVVDTSLSALTSHSGAVFAVACHPTFPGLIVSGGEDDLAYLSSPTNGETAKLTGHTDSVVAVAFSRPEGEFVATGGMDGRVRVWRHHTKAGGAGQWGFETGLEGPDEVNWLEWHPKGAVLLAGGSDGTLWMWQLPQGRVMQVFAGHTSSVTCGAFTPDGKAIVTASDDNYLITWDPRSGLATHKVLLTDSKFPFAPPAPPLDEDSEPTASSSGASCLALNGAGTLAFVGSTTLGAVVVVNLLSGQIVSGLQGGHSTEPETSVEAIEVFESGVGAGGGMVVTAGTDGRVCVWDGGSFKLRSVIKHDDPISSLVLHRSPQGQALPLITFSSDAALYTYDLRTSQLLSKHTGHSGVIHQLASSALPEGSGTVVSGSDDGTVRWWKVGQGTGVPLTAAGTAEVSHGGASQTPLQI